MRWLKAIIAEIFGLFVDDESFALAIIIWLGVVWLVISRLGIAEWAGVVLFAGLAAILVESALRSTRGNSARKG
jgi:hypothetical protein